MVEFLQVQGVAADPKAAVLPAKAESLAVNGEVCFPVLPILCPGPQWEFVRPSLGTVISAIVVRKGSVRMPKSLGAKPMSVQTSRFIQRVFVPILVAEYVATSKQQEQ
jgi:hypothetical protein